MSYIAHERIIVYENGIARDKNDLRIRKINPPHKKDPRLIWRINKLAINSICKTFSMNLSEITSAIILYGTPYLPKHRKGNDRKKPRTSPRKTRSTH